MKYEYQPSPGKLSFEKSIEILKERVQNQIAIGAINNTGPKCTSAVCEGLKDLGIPVDTLYISRLQYLLYIFRAEYKRRYPNYYFDNFYEKSLEHFLSYKLMDLKKGDNFIDIASEHSPIPEIFHRLTGCTSYSQDIMYDSGVHEYRIGCDAADIPVQNGFFKGAIATCSIEHFETDSDIRFMNEIGRLLVQGGKVVIVPLYLYSEEACQTDPIYAVQGRVQFDSNAVVYCTKDWGNRHGRFYSPGSLYARLIKPNKNMSFKVHILDNPEVIDDSVYCKFILEGTKI
ncbi:hypothetical protein [Methanofollis sp. UBA420]|jgi:hypothetical protein|uniref:hypothetical protein n=1 Tax=Methanofollis sp. UBA420 TaxID=1915514 RepID=UPI00316ACEB9